MWLSKDRLIGRVLHECNLHYIIALYVAESVFYISPVLCFHHCFLLVRVYLGYDNSAGGSHITNLKGA